MANKFLGEAGLDVLASQIKTRTYVGQMLDEVLTALDYFIANDAKVLDPTHPTPESVMAYVVLVYFPDTFIYKNCVDVDFDFSLAACISVRDKLNDELDKKVAEDMTYRDMIRSSAFLEQLLFARITDTDVNIQEITAQEVTDKFNS